MGLLSPVLDIITRNWAGINDKYYPGSAFFQRTASGIDISPETALNCSDFLACIRVMSETVAKLPANIIERTEKDGRAERRKAIDHPMFKLFHDAPNPEMSKLTFYELMVFDLVTWGRSYHQIVLRNDGNVDSLWRFNPSRMTLERNNDNSLRYIYKTQSGETKTYQAKEVLDIMGPLGGRSLVGLARESIGLASAAAKYGSGFFANDATAGVVIKSPVNLKKEGREELAKAYAEAQRGPENARKTLVLDQNMDITRMSLPPNDAQFLQTRQFMKEEIAGWCLVPPHLIGANDRSTYDTLEHQERAGITNMALPWTQRIAGTINNKFFVFNNEPFRLEFNFKILLLADTKAQSEFFNTHIANGTMNRNEVRAILDMNPMEGEQGDIHTVQMATVNLADVASGELFGTNSDMESTPQAEEEDRSTGPCKCIDCESTRETATWEERELEYRAIASARLRLREVWRAAIKAMANRIVKAEVAAIRKQIAKERSKRDAENYKIANIQITPEDRALKISEIVKRGVDDLKKWLDSFYKRLVKTIPASAMPTFLAYAEQINQAVALEIGLGAPPIEEFTKKYAEAFAERYTGSSSGQLQQMLTLEEIEERLVEWEAGRPDKIANREMVQLESAVSTHAFISHKRSRTWVTVGKNCPACNTMAGRTVTWEEPFNVFGDEVGDPDSDQVPVKIFRPMWHTPLHRGCDCYIVGS